MFAKLGMSIEDAACHFEKIYNAVYSNRLLNPVERAQKLKTCMEDLLSSKGLPLDLKLGRDERFTESGDCAGYVQPHTTLISVY
jgi:hypothetical protein